MKQNSKNHALSMSNQLHYALHTYRFSTVVLTLLIILLTQKNTVAASVTDEQLFSEAMTYIEAKQWQKAQNVLQVLLSHNNQLHRARVELAQVYLNQNKHQLAINELNQVLEINTLPVNVRQNLEHVKAQAEHALLSEKSQKTENSFNGYVDIATGYDSNVLFSFGDYFIEDDPYYDSFFVELADGSFLFISADSYVYDEDGNQLYKNNGQFELDTTKKSSQFNQLQLNLNHKLQLKPFNHLTWENNLDIKATDNNALNDYDKLQIKFNSDLSWQINKTFKSGISTHYRVLKRNSQVQVQSYGLKPYISYYNHLGNWELGFQWLNRDYKGTYIYRGDIAYVFDAVDSTTRNISLKWSKLFLANKLLLLAKFDYLDADAKSFAWDTNEPFTTDDYDYQGHKYSVAAVYSVHSDLKLSLTMINLTLNFSDNDTYYGNEQDTSTTIKSKLTYKINESFDVFLTAEHANRESDQYEGIKNDKSIAKVGIRIKF